MACASSDDSRYVSLCLSDIARWPPFRKQHDTLPKMVAGVPPLQRGLVWKPGQVELFWDSLLRSFPVGALVVCRKLPLNLQAIRDVEGDIDYQKVTHHLLDGQQRAQAIKLGFEDPFEVGSNPADPILWLDLSPDNFGETRSFLFRVTTKAHPWGYTAHDAASPVGIAKIRKSLEECNCDTAEDGLPRRPDPNGCWPIEARVPVPFAWLIGSAEGEPAALKEPPAFWAAVRSRCETLRSRPPHEKWASRAIDLLDHWSEQEYEHLRAILDGVKRARNERIVCLEVPQIALTAGSRQEVGVPSSMKSSTNISNVEHLFHRLNRGGTPLDGDELSYSMIKAHWPHLEKPISDLAAMRKLPKARLVTLAARLPFKAARDTPSTQSGRKITTAVSVSEIRRLAQQGSEISRSSFAKFFGESEPVNLRAVLQQVGSWLGPNENYDLPHVLQTSIARDSRDVYALLLWLAYRTLENPGDSDERLRKPIQGLITALHWFAWDKRRAVDSVISALGEDGPLRRDGFDAVLARAHETADGQRAFTLPLSMNEFENGLPKIGDSAPETWGCWSAVSRAPPLTKYVLERTLGQRELLLYAQRTYIKTRFGSYDPAQEETWAQHNRPWDFDHIVPAVKIDYQDFLHKETLKEWALQSIANERAWPMEANRSDKDERPKAKMCYPATDDTNVPKDVLKSSFITDGELDGFERGFDATMTGKDGVIDPLRDFVSAAIGRLTRIYSAWYDESGLDVGFLTGAH